MILIDEVLTPDSSRFWPADQYASGKGQPSFDKQFVRDYLETLTWDKTPPGPKLPDDVVVKTSAKYLEAYEKLTGAKALMQTLVEDFLQYLRHERGQSDNTARTYAALLGKFTEWAAKQNLTDWKSVSLKHLMAFLQHERVRPLADEPKESTKRLSSESVYLEIAALRAFYKFAENEKLLPSNPAENLSLPHRWKRLPKALSNDEIAKLLAPETPRNTGKLVRPGDFGTGLCFRFALERIEKSAAGTTSSRSRIHQCHRQRQQGTGRAGWQKSGRSVESLHRSCTAKIGHPKISRQMFSLPARKKENAARRSHQSHCGCESKIASGAPEFHAT